MGPFGSDLISTIDLKDPTVVVQPYFTSLLLCLLMFLCYFFNFPLWFGFLQRFEVFCYFTVHSSWAFLLLILTSPSLQSFTLIIQVESMISYDSSESFFSSAYFFRTLPATSVTEPMNSSIINHYTFISHIYTVPKWTFVYKYEQLITFETFCLSHACSSISWPPPSTLPVGLHLYQKDLLN